LRPLYVEAHVVPLPVTDVLAEVKSAVPVVYGAMVVRT
jgi:hypothetical protein